MLYLNGLPLLRTLLLTIPMNIHYTIILTYLSQTTFLTLLATLIPIPNPGYLLFSIIKSLLTRPEGTTALQALLLLLTGTVHFSLSFLTFILLLLLLLPYAPDVTLTPIQSPTSALSLFLQIWLQNYFVVLILTKLLTYMPIFLILHTL